MSVSSWPAYNTTRKCKWSFIFHLITGMKERSRPMVTWKGRMEKMGKLSPLLSHIARQRCWFMATFWGRMQQAVRPLSAHGYEASSPAVAQLRDPTLNTFSSHTSQNKVILSFFHFKKEDTWDIHLATAEGAERACSCSAKSFSIPKVSLDNSGRETLLCLNLQH